MIEAVFTLGSALLIALLGLAVLYTAKKDPLRWVFFGFALAMSFWQAMFFLSERQNEFAIIFNRLTFVGPILAATMFALFVRTLGHGLALKEKRLRYINSAVVIVVSGIGVVLSLTPLIVQGITPRINDVGDFLGYDVVHGPLYALYPIIFLILLAIAIVGLVRLRRVKDPTVRARTQAITLGVSFAAILGLVTNVVLPYVFNSSEYSYLGSLAVLALLAIMTIAIVKNKLINIQLIIARSFAYLASIVSITLIYSFSAILLIRLLLGDEYGITLSMQLILGSIFVVGALLFRPIKLWFDKQSNKLFYRDAYDSQQVIARANRTAVASIDIDTLLSSTGHIILESIKPQYLVFDLSPTGYMKRRLIGDVHHIPDEMKVEDVEKMMTENKVDTVIADEISQDYPDLYELMSDMRISYIQRLVLNTEEETRKYGLALLGAKKSGTPYSTQDKDTIRIVMGELSIALQNALQYEEIQRFNITLQDKVDDATKKIRATNEKLRKLDETKDEFISMASHQLRTPLTSIKGYLSMVLEGDAGDVTDAQKKMLNQAFVSSQRMVYLISDLLNLSRLNTGKFVIDPSPVDLRDIVAAEIDQLRETAKARDIAIAYDAPSSLPTLMLDETKIHQVVMNFMDNAIYYTVPGGSVIISLTETPTAVEFRVKDSGIGVPRAEQRHLFSKFYRAPNARKLRPDGTGLGLFMSKKVIAAQDGAVIFESEEGKGSTFGFRFTKATHTPVHTSDKK